MRLFKFTLELEDFEYDEDEETYYYPCPCGDRFAITKEELEAGEEIAECPSCSLIVKVWIVIYFTICVLFLYYCNKILRFLFVMHREFYFNNIFIRALNLSILKYTSLSFYIKLIFVEDTTSYKFEKLFLYPC